MQGTSGGYLQWARQNSWAFTPSGIVSGTGSNSAAPNSPTFVSGSLSNSGSPQSIHSPASHQNLHGATSQEASQNGITYRNQYQSENHQELDIIFARMNLELPKFRNKVSQDKLMFGATAIVVDKLPCLLERRADGKVHFRDEINWDEASEYMIRANTKLYSSIITSATPDGIGGGSEVLLGKLQQFCDVGDGLGAWRVVMDHVALADLGPATYLAELQALKFNGKVGLESYLVEATRLRSLAQASDAAGVLALAAAVKGCGDRDVVAQFELGRSTKGAYHFDNLIRHMTDWCTRLRQESGGEIGRSPGEGNNGGRNRQMSLVEPSEQKLCSIHGRCNHTDADCRLQQGGGQNIAQRSTAGKGGGTVQSPSRGKGGGGANHGDVPAGVCRFFWKGQQCQFGENCRFQHTTTRQCVVSESQVAESPAHILDALARMDKSDLEKLLAAANVQAGVAGVTERAVVMRVAKRYREDDATDEIVDQAAAEHRHGTQYPALAAPLAPETGHNSPALPPAPNDVDDLAAGLGGLSLADNSLARARAAAERQRAPREDTGAVKCDATVMTGKRKGEPCTRDAAPGIKKCTQHAAMWIKNGGDENELRRSRALVSQMSGAPRELLVADSGASNNTDTPSNVACVDHRGKNAVVCETAGGVLRADSGIVHRPYTGLSPGLALPGPRTLSTGRATAPTDEHDVPRMFLQAGGRAGMLDNPTLAARLLDLASADKMWDEYIVDNYVPLVPRAVEERVPDRALVNQIKQATVLERVSSILRSTSSALRLLGTCASTGTVRSTESPDVVINEAARDRAEVERDRAARDENRTTTAVPRGRAGGIGGVGGVSRVLLTLATCVSVVKGASTAVTTVDAPDEGVALLPQFDVAMPDIACAVNTLTHKGCTGCPTCPLAKAHTVSHYAGVATGWAERPAEKLDFDTIGPSARTIVEDGDSIRRAVTHETLIRDEYSGYLWSFQRNETHMTSGDTSEFLKQKVFPQLRATPPGEAVGHKTTRIDGGPELKGAAMAQLLGDEGYEVVEAPSGNSGDHAGNARISSLTKVFQDGVRAQLVHGTEKDGETLECMWPYASKTYTFNHNHTASGRPGKQGDADHSPGYRMLKVEVDAGKLFAFGEGVIATKPEEERSQKKHRYATRGFRGAVLGYRGSITSPEYVVLDLDELAASKRVVIHRTRSVRRDGGSFPLRALSDDLREVIKKAHGGETPEQTASFCEKCGGAVEGCIRCSACKGKKRKHTLKKVECKKTWCKCTDVAKADAVQQNTEKLLVTRLLNRRRDAAMYYSTDAVKARNAEARKLIEKGCISLDLPSEWSEVILRDQEAKVVPGAMLTSEKGCERPVDERSIKGRFIARGDLEENCDGEIDPDVVTDETCLPLQHDQLRIVLAAGVRTCKDAKRFAVAQADEENGYINRLIRSGSTYLDLKSSRELWEGIAPWDPQIVESMRRPVAKMNAPLYGLKRAVFDYESGRNDICCDRGCDQDGPSIFIYRNTKDPEQSCVIGWVIDDLIAAGDVDAVREFMDRVQQPTENTDGIVFKDTWKIVQVAAQEQTLHHIGIDISFWLDTNSAAVHFKFDMQDYAQALVNRIDAKLLNGRVSTAGAIPSATSSPGSGQFAESCRSLVSAAQHLGRVCMPELVQPLNSLSTRFNTWGTDEDRRLLHTFSYIYKAVTEGKVYIEGCVGIDDVISFNLYTDSDHAGCPFTRRSTGGHVSVLEGRITNWCLSWRSNIQKFVARCSGEAEGRAMQDGLSEELVELDDATQSLHAVSSEMARSALGQLALLERLVNEKVQMRLHVDATTAIACSRRGTSKLMRYLAKTQSVNFLWIREQIQQFGISVLKVESAFNLADVLTKCVSTTTLRTLLPMMGRAAISA